MKPGVFLVLLAGLLSASHLEGKDRGHFSTRGSAPFRHPGAIMGQGIRGHGIRGQGAFGFGLGRPGLGITRSWLPFGSGLGLYLREYNAPFQSHDEYAAPDMEIQGSQTIYYYQKPPKLDAKPNCQDSWTSKDSSSSLSNFMNKMFELQCENRHPATEANPLQGAETSKN